MVFSRISPLVIVCLYTLCCAGQERASTEEKLAHLNSELEETRSQLNESFLQIKELQRSLEALRSQVNGKLQTEIKSAEEPTSAEADENVTFLAAKVNEMHQDKVESASKYPVKLSGLVLFNAYTNRGSLDIQDLPNLAFPSFPGSLNGSTGMTLRQTVLGLSAIGPQFWGAHSSADISIDFAGGSPTTSYGVTAGLFRLRTARLNLDWKRTSLIIGQDAPFFSPLSPTSYATVLEPAMSWAGNLWVWTPEIELEHRLPLSTHTSLIMQGGVLDALTEEIPSFQGRNPTAGEATRYPAIAGRIALDHSETDHPLTIGFGAYRARQQYEAFDAITSWTVNTDFRFAPIKRLEFSGEWYTGQAAGGLGGGIWSSVIFSDPLFPHSAIRPLRSTGGWAQLKFKPTSRFEVNAAAGQDENSGNSLHFFANPISTMGFPPLQKNRAEFVNFIYTPNSVLLFSAEYRHLFTAPVNAEGSSGDHINLGAGVRF
jgi:hypothetical protein